MKPATQRLLETMQRGEEISAKSCILRHGQSNCDKRMTELRAAGIDVREKWVMTDGERQKVYFLATSPAETMSAAEKQTQTTLF